MSDTLNIPLLFSAVTQEDDYANLMFEKIHHQKVIQWNTDQQKNYLAYHADESIDLEGFHQPIASNLVNVFSKKYIGHMTGPVPPIVYHLNKVELTLNQNLVKFETSGSGTPFEKNVLTYFHKAFFQKPEAFYQEQPTCGVFTNGGTISNITAIQYALNDAFKAQDIKKIGLKKCLDETGYKNMVVIGSPMTHYSVKKALRLLGLGDDAFIAFDADKIDAENRQQLLEEKINLLRAENYFVLAIIGIAGTTESGEIDDLDGMATVARKMGIHFHVDAAFGGAFILSDVHAPKLKGIEKADTVSLCGHKNLYMPIGTSMLLCANPQLLEASEINSSYQARKMSVDLGKYTIEGTRKFSSFVIGNIIEKWGKGVFEEVLNNNVTTAQRFANLLHSDNFELYKEPVLNIVLYRFIPTHLSDAAQNSNLSDADNEEINQLNEQLQQIQFEHGSSFVSHTKLKKMAQKPAQVWLRAVFMNPFTTPKDLTEIIQEQLEIGQSLTK